MAKVIVLLADGTGNSAAKLFKTNVWRLYRALDLSDSPPTGLRQIAYYHDGVGTSSFKPLTILGGVFGIGLKRNVRDLYSFLCRNYQPGDRIYVFGFSRGAFTVRVLASLIATQGILKCPTEQELSRYVPDMYRRYRRRYKLPLLGRKDQTAIPDEEEKVGLVDRLRDLRDAVVRLSRRMCGYKQFEEVRRNQVEKPESIKIDFIGVWDTVAAYGLPIDELTRGVDEWIWPLSMPNNFLSDKVLRARHALSLDDERYTFHPMLWDETRETNNGRLQQVWFAGMHSDVGGGYPDDSLSGAALEWMMAESAKPIRDGDATGLRFLPPEDCESQLVRSDFGPLHNSRSGLGSYYRYQPRRIVAYTEPPDPTTRMIQDPNRNGQGLLKEVLVHESVLNRINAGNDRYAPIVLPNQFKELKSDGTTVPHTLSPAGAPAAAAGKPQIGPTEWVWNDVWRRRVNYFMTVGVSLVLALLPWIHSAPSACVGPQCVLTPVITTVGAILPGFVQPWIEAFASAPGLSLMLAIVIMALMARSANLKRRINDGMRSLWDRKAGQSVGAMALDTRGRTDDRIYRLRTHRWYQTFFQWLKWRILPGGFGAAMLFGGMLAIAAVVVLIVHRADIAVAEWTNRHCKPTEIDKLRAADGNRVSPLFETKSKCWASGIKVEEGERYVLTLHVTKDWVDRTIPTTPLGFESSRHVWYVRPFVLLRRSLSGHWFQPMVKIVPAGGGHGGHTQFAEMRCRCGQGPSYSAEFKAERSGELMLFVNDVMPLLLPRLWPALTFGEADDVYDNNKGEAQVTIMPVPSKP